MVRRTVPYITLKAQEYNGFGFVLKSDVKVTRRERRAPKKDTQFRN